MLFVSLIPPHVGPICETGKAHAVATTIKLLSKQREGYLCFVFLRCLGAVAPFPLSFGRMLSYVAPLTADILENESITNGKQAAVATTTDSPSNHREGYPCFGVLLLLGDVGSR